MSSTSPTTPPHKLERIGRYRIVRPLSKGGMALVYEARRESLAGVSPRVAIKLILPDFANSDTFQELFINEARLGASMHHQNLVQIQDFDRDADTNAFYIVMEYVEGLTLRRAITLCARNDILIPSRVIAEVGRQACDGLHFAHTANDDRGNHLRLVHRDIKPSNLILNPQGVIKILDFGIARGALMREKKGSVKGTWGYMAPEQALGHDVGPAADVFGLGTVLYEMAARKPLFQKKKPAEIKRLLLDDHAARMAATLDPSFGPLVNVLVRALQRDPAARFANASEMGRALSALLPDPITARDEVSRHYQIVTALNEGLPVPASSRSQHTGAGTGHTNATAASFAQASAVTDSGGGLLAPVLMILLVLMGMVMLAGMVVLLLVPGFNNRGETQIPQVPPRQAGIEAGVIDADAQEGTAESTPEAGSEGTSATPDPASGEGTDTTPTPEAPSRPPPAAVSRPAPSTSVGAATLPPKEEEEPKEPVKKVIVVDRTQPAEPTPVPTPQPTVQVSSAPAATGPGMITISAKQPAEVYVDGQFIRKTPLVRREFPAGRHMVTIVATDGRRKQFEIDLKAGEDLRRVWDFDRAEWRQ